MPSLPATPMPDDARARGAPHPGASFSRLSEADALAMYHELSIHELGRLAFERVMQFHPEPYRTYVVDRNINYSNVCTAKCIFCNFKADPGDPDGYILSFEQIGRKIEELIEIGGTQILMQGGLVPGYPEQTGQRPVPRGREQGADRSQVGSPEGEDGNGEGAGLSNHALPFEWYLDLLRFIRRNYPTIHIHAFSPPEIWAFHQVYRMPLRDVLLRLQEAGLDTIPGGGGEILVDRVRRRIGQGKTLTAEWLEVMRHAHRLGMKTSCTMMFGHIETIEERIEHLRLLRELQDETGGFTAFIHWPFQPEGTKLGRWKRLPIQNLPRSEHSSDSGSGAWDHAGALAAQTASADRKHRIVRPLPDGEHLLLADAHEYLVMLAIARLYLDNIPNIQSSWVTMGPKIGQLALFYGANDMGSVMMEENVVSRAGSTFRLSEQEIRRLIADAGWIPQQRDQYYRPVTTERRRPAAAPAPQSSSSSRGASTPGRQREGADAPGAASVRSSGAGAPCGPFVPLTIAGHE